MDFKGELAYLNGAEVHAVPRDTDEAIFTIDYIREMLPIWIKRMSAKREALIRGCEPTSHLASQLYEIDRDQGVLQGMEVDLTVHDELSTGMDDLETFLGKREA